MAATSTISRGRMSAQRRKRPPVGGNPRTSVRRMLDHVSAIERESRRFLELVSATSLATPVPSCPGWTVSDLTWHLAEVQHSWASIAAGLLEDPAAVPELARPPDSALTALVADTAAALVAALAARKPDDACWSWDPNGRNVGWVRRRQAHEALIHRVDAELAAGTDDIDVDADLAADGVDELLTRFMDASDIPAWSSFVPTAAVVELRLEGDGRSWFAQLGRFQGTSPTSGSTYDEEAIRLVPQQQAGTTIHGAAGDFDRWLWGRGPLDSLEVTGDGDGALWIRAAAVHATQ